jgi:hypothetical protein
MDQNRLVDIIQVTAPSPGWKSLGSAPRGKPILLLIRESAGLAAAVGWRGNGSGGWFVRLPNSTDPIEVFPKKWAPVPPLPGAA